MHLVQSSHATHASYARNIKPELCVHGTMAEVLACMYAGPAGMDRLALDLETGTYEQTKIVPGKSGQTLNRTYLNTYIRQCMLVAGVGVVTPAPADFEWCSLSHAMHQVYVCLPDVTMFYVLLFPVSHGLVTFASSTWCQLTPLAV